MTWHLGNILAETDYTYSLLIADERRHIDFLFRCVQSREAMDLFKRTGNKIFAANGKIWLHTDPPVGQHLHDLIYEICNHAPQIARLAIRSRVLVNLAKPHPNLSCGCINCDSAVRNLEDKGDKIWFLVNKVSQEREVVVASSAQEACQQYGWNMPDTYIKEIR